MPQKIQLLGFICPDCGQMSECTWQPPAVRVPGEWLIKCHSRRRTCRLAGVTIGSTQFVSAITARGIVPRTGWQMPDVRPPAGLSGDPLPQPPNYYQ